MTTAWFAVPALSIWPTAGPRHLVFRLLRTPPYFVSRSAGSCRRMRSDDGLRHELRPECLLKEDIETGVTCENDEAPSRNWHLIGEAPDAQQLRGAADDPVQDGWGRHDDNDQAIGSCPFAVQGHEPREFLLAEVFDQADAVDHVESPVGSHG